MIALPTRWRTPAILLGLWALAFLAALPIVTSPIYWDESVHYFTARHGSPVDPHFHDLWGNPINSPHDLFWQRPAWYALFFLPAQGDVETFRIAHAAIAAGLAPIGYALVRSFGASGVPAVAAGLTLALAPPLPRWTALGFMDPMMAEALGLAVVAWRHGRWRTAGVLAALAVWFKETALIFLLAWLAIELARGWLRGGVHLRPLQADERVTALLYATIAAPLPLLYGMMGDVPVPGGIAYNPTAQILDAAAGTPWLVVPLAIGLLLRRSRAAAALGLAVPGFFVVLHLLDRGTESWYLIPAILFAVVGAAVACDAAWKTSWRRGATVGVAASLLAVGTLGAVGGLVLAPSDGGREHVFPFSGTGPRSLLETYHDELYVRDQELEAAFAALPIDGRTTLVMIEPHWPPEYVRLANSGPVIMDLAFVRAVVAFDIQDLAAAIEANGTWTMHYDGKHPMQKAVLEVYADCVVERFGGISLIVGAPCAGRGDELAAADRRHGGPVP